MMLWIIAGMAAFVLVAALLYLVLRREEEPPVWAQPRHSHPWDRRPEEPEGSMLASIPPPAGVPINITTASMEASGLESTEVFFEEEEATGPVPRIVVVAAGGTDPGLKRHHNEDAYMLLPSHDVFVIADGMGGYAAGEVAAQLAVDTVREAFENGEFGPLEEGIPRRGAELMAAVRQSNVRIRDEAARDARKTGMGTTIVAARFAPGRKRVYVAHVGDSRCYRLREQELVQLTVDHTLGAMGISGPQAAKLSRAVGVFEAVEVDLTIDEPMIGDEYLLCSDGLYKMVPEETIGEVLRTTADLQGAVDRLVRVANERGGRDNVSVVLMRVDEPAFNARESGEHPLN